MRVIIILGMLMPILCSIARAQTKHAPLSDTQTHLPVDSVQRSKEKTKELKAVVVTAHKPLLEQLADRIIVHVDALISNTGTNALEVLAGTPGLEVDDDGIISLKGRAGVLVMIDGRPSQLTGVDLANYLKSLPSGVLDRIELMSNPPAKYAAAGTGGVINIITKKSKAMGFSGSVTGNFGLGIYSSSNNSVLFNYRHNKLTFSGNLSGNLLNNYFSSDRVRNYFNPDGSSNGALIQHYYERSNKMSSNSQLGLTWQCAANTFWDLGVSGSLSPYDERGNYWSRYLHAGGALDSSMLVNSHLWNKWGDGNIFAGFRHHFDTAGTELNAGGNFYTDRRSQHQILTTSIYGADNNLKSMDDLLPRQPFTNNSWSVHADYSRPMAKGMKIETGWQTNVSQINSLSAYTSRYYYSAVPDSAWSGQFLFDETIHAAYGTFSKNWRRFSLQTGLRVESTISTGHVPGNNEQPDTAFTRRYTNLFPTTYFSYKTDQHSTHQVFLSLGRRINRPDYQTLNPSPFFFDKWTIYTGNPLLKPEFSYNGELSYVYKQNLTATILYSDGRDLIMQTFQQQGKIFVVSSGNIGRVISRGINIGATIPITRWWKGVVYTEFYNNSYWSQAAGIPVNPNGNAWRISGNNQFKAGNGWSAEINVYYRSRSVQVQSISQPVWYMNATIQKKLSNDKWIANLGLRDVFHTRIFRRELNTLPGQVITLVNVQDSRVLSLSLTYKFGKTGNNKSGEHATDARTEINRLKNGN
jgi:iron complex outermembrane recepter protein